MRSLCLDVAAVIIDESIARTAARARGLMARMYGARGRSRTGTAEAEGFSYPRQLSLLSLLKRHLGPGLSLYHIAKDRYDVGRSRQVSTLSLAPRGMKLRKYSVTQFNHAKA